MNKYEIMYIVRADIEESLIKETQENFEKILTNMKAKILSSKEFGNKKLAYDIKKQNRGFYFVLTTEASKDAVAEFDRKALIDEKILRHLIIKLDEE